MAQLSAIYATALFDLASESGVTHEYLEQAIFLRDVLGSADVQAVILHPQISAREKTGFLQGALSGHIRDDLMGFLRLVIDKNRESFLLPALALFIERLKASEKKTTAYITAVTELDEEQAETLIGVLSRKLSKEVELEVTVDPSVIGGFSVYVDGYLIDRTVKKQLQDMKTSVKRSMAHDS